LSIKKQKKMTTELYNFAGTIKRDSNSYVVTSSKVHNVPELHADKVYANEFILTGPSEVIVGDAALSLSTKVSFVDSTAGVLALTLADGTYEGQTKVVVHSAGTNDAVLTPATLLGGTTITTTDVGPSYTLTWLNGSWVATATGPTIGAGVVIA
jgi:hypothetical protein